MPANRQTAQVIRFDAFLLTGPEGLRKKRMEIKLQVMPDYDPLRSHPRFQSLLSRLNFPDGPRHG